MSRSSVFKTQYNLGKGLQATVISTPDTQQSLRYDYIETPLQSTCDHQSGFHSRKA